MEKARATLVRRGADPPDNKKGPINANTPHPPSVPSHHGPDVQTVIPSMDVDTMAVDVPTTLMHTHAVMLRTKENPSQGEVQRAFEDTPRVILVDAGEGFKSTAQIMEMGRDMLRPRSDVNEITVWRESIYTGNDDLYYLQAIHQESNVVPESVDAIRAMTGLEEDTMRSIEKMDRAMGIC